MLRFPFLLGRSQSQNAYNYNGPHVTVSEFQGQTGLSDNQFIPPGSAADGCPKTGSNNLMWESPEKRQWPYFSKHA